jgi:AcrR family transcriptional regulator
MPTARSAPSTGPRTQRRGAGSAKSAQRIVDIVRASRAVFSERGYEATTTTEIADRLGISEGTIFTYFSGKRDLCARVIEDWYDEIIAQIEDGMPRGRSLRAQFAFVVRAHLRLFLVQGTGMCALVLTEGPAAGQPARPAAAPLHRAADGVARARPGRRRGARRRAAAAAALAGLRPDGTHPVGSGRGP